MAGTQRHFKQIGRLDATSTVHAGSARNAVPPAGLDLAAAGGATSPDLTAAALRAEIYCAVRREYLAAGATVQGPRISAGCRCCVAVLQRSRIAERGNG